MLKPISTFFITSVNTEALIKQALLVENSTRIHNFYCVPLGIAYFHFLVLQVIPSEAAVFK